MTKFEARRDGSVLDLKFGEPGRLNMMDEQWFVDFEKQLYLAQQDDEVRVVLLSTEGKSFCAGGDLKEFQAGPWPDGFLRSGFVRALMLLGVFEKPIVTTVNGAAIGGGTTFLLHSDFVYSTEDSRFQLPFTNIGIVPEIGASYLLPLFAGMRLASELILLGRPFTAATAVRAGIVNEIVPADKLMDTARETAYALAALPPASMRATKRIMKTAHLDAYTKAWRTEGQALQECFAGDEIQEFCDAFLNKRKPDFSRFK